MTDTLKAPASPPVTRRCARATSRPHHHRRDPARGPRGHLRHPRLRREAARAALRRPAVPRRVASRATRSRATASGAAPTSCSARGTRSKPLQLKIPITIAGMSFGALSGTREGSARPRRQRGRHRRPRPATAA
jgi:glutamate synthase domain-containing protein 2